MNRKNVKIITYVALASATLIWAAAFIIFYRPAIDEQAVARSLHETYESPAYKTLDHLAGTYINLSGSESDPTERRKLEKLFNEATADRDRMSKPYSDELTRLQDVRTASRHEFNALALDIFIVAAALSLVLFATAPTKKA